MHTSIAVCALTLRRPDGLSRLIRGLNELTFRAEPPHLTIVVVDNDPAGSARQTCEQLAAEVRWPIKYVLESRRGIPFARNTALDNVGNAEWICFIDDDEVPNPCWLDELLRVREEHDADVVAGPVESHFPTPIPAWMIAGRFFDRQRYPTGQRLHHAHTGNVLLRRRIVNELDLRFNERWALAGGTDALFFQRIDLAGYKIVWADDAVAIEWVPASRATARWILQRAFRYGNSGVRVTLDLHPELRPHAYLLVRAAKRIIAGVGLLPVSWIFGRRHAVKSLRHICYGAGMITGWFGMGYREYHQTHGT